MVTAAQLATAGGAAAQVNTRYGQNCLPGLTTGTNNSAYGYAAMRDTTTGHNNSAFGYAALHDTTSGEENAAFGRGAMYRNTIGFGNTAVGAHALYNNDDGSNNVAIGWSAMGANVYGFGNAAVGNRALEDMVEGDVPGLAFITKLRPVTYYWDERKLREFSGTEPTGDAAEARKYTGFIAQEVEAAAKLAAFDFSGVVAPPNDKTAYQLSYAEFVVPLVRAVQEQQKEIEELSAAVANQSSPAGATRWLMLLAGVVGGVLGSLLILRGLERARRLAAPFLLRQVREASLASK
jgi:hypothetical protein